MSDFSVSLEKYIHRKNYTVQNFAALCDINRTLLQKYLSGQRFPKNKEILFRMIRYLCLTPEEKRELMESWEKEYYGETVYLQHRSIRAMLESFGEMVKNREYNLDMSIQTQTEIQMPKGAVPISSRHMLISLMWQVVEYECKKEKADFYLICQAENGIMDNMIKYMALRETVSICHLVRLNADKEANQQYNICLFNRIIPYICGKADYHARFYYGGMDGKADTTSTLSAILITEEFVFVFDEAFRRGILYKDVGFWNFWMDIFREKNARAESFFSKYESMLDTVVLYQAQHPCSISCQLQPCLAYTLSAELLHQVMLPCMLGQQGIIEEFVKMMAVWGREAQKNGRPANVNYFLASGIDDFLETGRVGEFPSEFYNPLPVPVRCRMLEIFCEQMESGLLDAYLINEKEFTLDPSLVIQVCGMDAVHFIYCRPDGSQIIMRVTENSIVSAFREFLFGLRDSDNVRTKEETIAYVRKKLEEMPEYV